MDNSMEAAADMSEQTDEVCLRTRRELPFHPKYQWDDSHGSNVNTTQHTTDSRRPRAASAAWTTALRETESATMGTMTNTPDVIWLSRRDLAQRLSVPDKTPAEWATKGTGPPYARFGKHCRYRLTDVIEWENSRRVTSA